jgi:hypothetical protein
MHSPFMGAQVVMSTRGSPFQCLRPLEHSQILGCGGFVCHN